MPWWPTDVGREGEIGALVCVTTITYYNVRKDSLASSNIEIAFSSWWCNILLVSAPVLKNPINYIIIIFFSSFSWFLLSNCSKCDIQYCQLIACCMLSIHFVWLSFKYRVWFTAGVVVVEHLCLGTVYLRRPEGLKPLICINENPQYSALDLECDCVTVTTWIPTKTTGRRSMDQDAAVILWCGVKAHCVWVFVVFILRFIFNLALYSGALAAALQD